MLNRRLIPLFRSKSRSRLRNRGSSPVMAVNSIAPAIFSGFSHLSEVNERCLIQNRVSLDMGIGSGLNLKNGLSMKSWISIGRDQIQKSCAMARYRQINGSELFLVKDSDAKSSVNGSGECGNGKPLGFPGKPSQEKLVVAVDVDEVLGSFLSALNKFIADRCSWNHSVSEYHVYEFFKIWKCSRAEADILVHEFFKTHYFKDGIHPIPGALSALQHLSSFCSLSVVTSRQNAIRDHTLKWLEKHYPGLFEEIHFGNHFALDGQSKPKSEICRNQVVSIPEVIEIKSYDDVESGSKLDNRRGDQSADISTANPLKFSVVCYRNHRHEKCRTCRFMSLGAQFLIDDNPRYALECAEVGIKVLLFDYHNSYPWCKTGVEESHPLVTKVHNWQEVQQKLTSLVISEC